MSNDAQIEAMIVAKGKTAPRITKERIDGLIDAAKVQYHVFPGTTVTVACATLPNGFSLVGHSAAASPENFDSEIGQVIALGDAKRQLWGHEGYHLRTMLTQMEQHRYGATSVGE